MPEIPPEAVQAAAQVLAEYQARPYGDLRLNAERAAAKAVLAAAPLLAEHIAQSLVPVWEWTREVAAAHGTTYGVDAVGQCMRIARDAFGAATPSAPDAPARGSEPPHGALTPDPGDVGSTDDPTTVGTPTALRNRIARALIARIKQSVISGPMQYGMGQIFGATEYDLADTVMAVLADEAIPLEERGLTLIATSELERLRAALADYENTITWNTTCHGCAAALDASYAETVRAEKAEAANAHVRDRLLTLEAWAHRELPSESQAMHSVLSMITDLRVALDVPADGEQTPETTEETDHA